MNLLEYLSILNYAATIIRLYKEEFKVFNFFPPGEKGLDNIIQISIDHKIVSKVNVKRWETKNDHS